MQRKQEEENAKEEEKAKYNDEGEVDSDPEAIETRKKLNKVVDDEKAQVEELAAEDLADIDEWTRKASGKNKDKKKKNEKNKGQKH